MASSSTSGYTVIYMRCSTEMQLTEGLSLETQEKACVEFAKQKGLQIRAIFSDGGKSGTTMNHRDGLKNALGAIQKGDVLLIYSLSRLTREVSDINSIIDELDRKQAFYLSVTEPLSGNVDDVRFMTNLFTLMNKRESRIISQRVKGGMETHKEKFGTSNNKTRYGWKYHQVGKGSNAVVTLLPVRHEQEVIKIIKKMRATPYTNPKFQNAKPRLTPYANIAEYLNTKGIPTRLRRRDPSKSSCQWHASAIKNILDAEGDLDPTKNDHEYPDDDDVEHIIPDTYLYLLIKSTNPIIGTANSLQEIYVEHGNIKKYQIYIFSCKSSQEKKQVLIDWLEEQQYIDREESDSVILPSANRDDILEHLKKITRNDTPIITTTGEIPNLIQVQKQSVRT